MKSLNIRIPMFMVCLVFALAAQAQEFTKPSPTTLAKASDARQAQSETIIPRLIKFSGTLLDAQERPLVGPVGVTFALYAQQSGSAALWMETQNVQPDASGNYIVLLGANSTHGVPAELFVSGEARWLGIQVGQQFEHERILLVSVPYALKAGDAETLGGLPASAFVTTGLANTANSANSAAAIPSAAGKTQTTTGTSAKTSATPQAATPCSSVTSDGTATTKSIGLFTTACNMEGSLMSQATINGFPGINLAGNNAGLLLNGTGTHQVQVTGSASSGRLGQDSTGFFFASDTNGKVIKFLTNNGTLNEWMRITGTGNVGIGTTTPAAKLEVAGNVKISGTGNGLIFPNGNAQTTELIGSYNAWLGGRGGAPNEIGVYQRMTLAAPITVVRFQMVLLTPGSGCTPQATVEVTDGTNAISLATVDGQMIYDSGPITQNYNAGANLDFMVTSAPVCSVTTLKLGNASVQYKAQ